jgi:hypothetical protein
MAESDFYKGIFVGILFGIILGLIFFNMYIYLSRNLQFLAKILSTVNLPPYVLNSIIPQHRAFIEGELDGIYLSETATRVCRYSNIKKAIDIINFNAYLPCIVYENGQIVCPAIPIENATIYIIFNDEHLRTAVYENNTLTIIDLVNPYYKFDPSNTIILSCHIKPIEKNLEENVMTICDAIYVNGLRAFTNLPVDSLLYEEVFKYNRVDIAE